MRGSPIDLMKPEEAEAKGLLKVERSLNRATVSRRLNIRGGGSLKVTREEAEAPRCPNCGGSETVPCFIEALRTHD